MSPPCPQCFTIKTTVLQLFRKLRAWKSNLKDQYQMAGFNGKKKEKEKSLMAGFVHGPNWSHKTAGLKDIRKAWI